MKFIAVVLFCLFGLASCFNFANNALTPSMSYQLAHAAYSILAMLALISYQLDKNP